MTLSKRTLRIMTLKEEKKKGCHDNQQNDAQDNDTKHVETLGITILSTRTLIRT